MRRLFSSAFLFIYIGFFIFSPFVSAQGAPTGDNAKTLEITLSATAIANENFDVTVRAVKPDGSTNTTFTGTIYFAVEKAWVPVSAGDNATIPYDINGEVDGYIFDLDAQGQKAFTWALWFKLPSAGEYTIAVVDESGADVDKKTLTVTGGGITTPQTETVTITEPVSQMTVSGGAVNVRGTSKPTSTINISVNGTKQNTTNTNTEGGFESSVTLSTEWENIIKVDVLDWTSTVIGTSSVTIRYSLDAPKITSLDVKEGNQIFAGSVVNLEAIGDAGLKTVTVKFGGQTVVLEEDPTHPGIYKGTVQVTGFEWEVKPVVSAETFTGWTADFPNLYNLNVITSSFENVKAEGTPDKKARFTFSLKPDLEEIKYFKIKYGSTAGVPDKEVITYEKSQIKEGTQYTWYIPGVSNGEYFATIIGLDKDKKELSVKSGEQTFAILDSGTTCYIDKVSGVTVKKSGKVSTLSWDKLADAASYQIFKKDASGEYAMIDEITDTSYKINIDMTAEEEIFEDFQIRATCKNGDITGEGDYSDSVSVQTWPVAIMFMLFMIASGTAFILMKRGYLK